MPALTLARPTLGSNVPLKVVVDPLVMFSILDHALRRPADSQERVIGTLLGVRSEDGTEVEIRNCFAVPHNESSEQVEVDMEYHKTMYALHQRANPKEVLVGWYATHPSLNAFSALIQNFYASEIPSGPCVHLTMSTKAGKEMAVETYVSSVVGITPERAADSCLFVPVASEVRYGDAERTGLEVIASAKASSTRTAIPTSDISALERSITEVLSMIDRVSAYVSRVLSGSERANNAVGRFLMDTLSQAPKLDETEVEKMFNSHLQDVLMVVYLAETVRTQLAIGSKLVGLV
ncbi:Mov34-domain-containing protein, partial [Saitoella complicata NRRL Y-17804]